MIKISTLLFVISLFSVNLIAQTQGLIPFVGVKYIENGISAKKIEIRLSDNTWISNRLPINTSFKIKLEKPVGFVADDKNEYYPACEILILKSGGDTLGYAENMFQNQLGMDPETLSSLTLTLGFNDNVGPGDSLRVYARFYDLFSKNDLVFDFPVVIVKDDLPLENTWSEASFKSYTGYDVRSSGVDINNVMCKLDTVSKNEVYHSISIEGITLISRSMFQKGKMTYTLYDENMNEIKIPKDVIMIFESSKEDMLVFNLYVKIPVDSKNEKMLNSSVRVRWESVDHTRVIDAYQIQRAF